MLVATAGTRHARFTTPGFASAAFPTIAAATGAGPAIRAVVGAVATRTLASLHRHAP